jgi:hypothetical protein
VRNYLLPQFKEFIINVKNEYPDYLEPYRLASSKYSKFDYLPHQFALIHKKLNDYDMGPEKKLLINEALKKLQESLYAYCFGSLNQVGIRALLEEINKEPFLKKDPFICRLTTEFTPKKSDGLYIVYTVPDKEKQKYEQERLRFFSKPSIKQNNPEPEPEPSKGISEDELDLDPWACSLL